MAPLRFWELSDSVMWSASEEIIQKDLPNKAGLFVLRFAKVGQGRRKQAAAPYKPLATRRELAGFLVPLLDEVVEGVVVASALALAVEPQFLQLALDLGQTLALRVG